MVYEATARIGIDVKEIKVTSDDIKRVVKIKLPQASVLDVTVDTETIKYFDEHFALFNVNSKEDANKANALAEQEAKTELSGMGILDMANGQASTLIKGLIQDAVPANYTIEVQQSK